LHSPEYARTLQTTDDRQITYSERERECTFAKNPHLFAGGQKWETLIHLVISNTVHSVIDKGIEYRMDRVSRDLYDSLHIAG